MPRPNLGPQLAFLPKRGRYYIRWFRNGQERLRSTGTDDETRAFQALEEFRSTDAHLRPVQSYVSPSRAYFIGGDVGAIKIGAASNVEARLMTIQGCSPIPLRILATAAGGLKQERAYHQRFAAHRLHGEWFERHPDILAEIERLSA